MGDIRRIIDAKKVREKGGNIDLIAEAHALARGLSNRPQIATLYNCYEYDKEGEHILYIVSVRPYQFTNTQEYYKDGSLKELVDSKNKISEYRILCIAKDVLAGLNCLHTESRILHRDLSLDNILIRHDSEYIIQVCINDFDLLREFNAEGNNSEELTSAGKDGYRAPEVHYQY